ncbi:hypothetical protein IHE44_0011604 [Lamprotornis superbus]|uniref:Fibronectin type-III domain-containing protein n=1 Tax=Lamprotornis superbus TaxID=245042 RepID=A0A835NLU2_9PASS|nr:hypothetical protein IHE44_0011604 [Lamprotornis superbus]
MTSYAGKGGQVMNHFMILAVLLPLGTCYTSYSQQESDVFPVTYLNISKDLDLQRLLVEWDVVKSAHDAELAMSFEIQVRRTDEATTVWTVFHNVTLDKLRKPLHWTWDSDIPLECMSHAVRIRSKAEASKIWSNWGLWETVPGLDTSNRSGPQIFPKEKFLAEGSAITLCCIGGKGQTIKEFSVYPSVDVFKRTNSQVRLLTVENLSHDKGSNIHFYCYDEDGQSHQEAFFVGKPPDTPKDFSCHTQDMKRVTCTWREAETYLYGRNSPQYTLSKTSSPKIALCKANCFKQCSCSWDIGHQRIWNVTVTVENPLGKKTATYIFDHNSSVADSKRVTVRGLQPYTEYRARVRCGAAKHFWRWSEWSQPLTTRTKEGTPSGKLDIWREITPVMGGRTVTLFWKALKSLRKDRLQPCDLQWKRFAPNTSSAVISSGVRYKFCIYGSVANRASLLEKKIGYLRELPPRLDPIVRKVDLTYNSVTLSWDSYLTNESEPGFVRGYHVYVSPVQGNCNLKGSKKHILSANILYFVFLVVIVPTLVAAICHWKMKWVKECCCPAIPSPNKSKVLSFKEFKIDSEKVLKINDCLPDVLATESDAEAQKLHPVTWSSLSSTSTEDNIDGHNSSWIYPSENIVRDFPPTPTPPTHTCFENFAYSSPLEAESDPYHIPETLEAGKTNQAVMLYQPQCYLDIFHEDAASTTREIAERKNSLRYISQTDVRCLALLISPTSLGLKTHFPKCTFGYSDEHSYPHQQVCGEFPQEKDNIKNTYRGVLPYLYQKGVQHTMSFYQSINLDKGLVGFWKDETPFLLSTLIAFHNDALNRGLGLSNGMGNELEGSNPYLSTQQGKITFCTRYMGVGNEYLFV